MKNEMKIVLPSYKVLFSILTVIFLSIFRNITSTIEIGVSIVAFISLLASVMISDTFLLEEREQRWELYALYSFHTKRSMLYKRVFIQIGYMILLTTVGYGLFYLQRPRVEIFSTELHRYFECLLVVVITSTFFSTLTLVISNITHNMWYGIGLTLIVWLCLQSIKMQQMLGKYNVFAYTERFNNTEIEKPWAPGIVVALLITLVLLIILPKTIENRRNRLCY